MSQTNLKQFRQLQNPVAKYSEEWNAEVSLPYYPYSLRCRFEPLLEPLLSDTYASRPGI